MRKIFFGFVFTIISTILIAQPTNYYESCTGLYGDALRTELHNIIKDHQSFSYTTTKTILREADEDYNNPANILLVYTGNSIDKFDFASNFEPDFWNREHVWPKSHGDFDADDPFEVPAYTDAHNLKPVDHSMNTLRGEKDFDLGGEIVLNGDTETECYTTNSTFEPRDEVKGDIARMIFYMDLRYEGGTGEPNLVAVEGLTTYPNPQIGSLSTLLQWHEQDPPDAFEKRRNDVIYKWQGNRNPFIDYPQFVDYLFDENPQINPVDITNVTLNPGSVEGGQNFIISANVLSAINCPIQSVTLNYGNSWWETTSNSIEMIANNNGEYECQVPGQPYNTMFCYSITATICDEVSQIFFGSEIIPPYPFEGIITPISEIQGGTEYSPYEGQAVNTTGIVTGAFANSFYLQDGSEPWSGIYIYSGSALPAVGDSVIVSGEISEFCWDGSPCDCASCGGAGVTEFYQPDNIYIISNNNELPEPILVNSGEALSEQYEGVLIKMNNVECVSDANGFGVWGVNDGSGVCGIHNTPDGYEHDYQIGEVYNITGIVTSTFNEWKVDLRMPSDVESGPDTTPPYIINHECYQVGDNYYIYLFFNEEINTDYVNEYYFYVSGGDIQNINIDTFDPTKVIISLENVTSTSFIVNVFEILDLIGNSAENIFYQFNCDFDLNIEEEKNMFRIFPNPNEGSFIVELYEKENEVLIFDVQGKLILEKKLPNGSTIINLENKGFYYIQINNADFVPLLIK